MADVKKVETKVEKVEVNLDEIFNGHLEQNPLHSQKKSQKNLTYLVDQKM